MTLIKDTTFQQITNEINRRNGILKEFASALAVNQWDKIRMDVVSMPVEELAIKYPIGAELICGYEYNGTIYNFPWVVLDNNRECVWQDGSVHPGLWLGAKYTTIESMEFDAPENTEATEETAQEGWYYFYKSGDDYVALNLATGDTLPYSTYTTIYKTGINSVDAPKAGYNRYKDSAIRQWLNSSADAGGWWTAQHLGDVAPSVLSTYKGFMAGFEDDFLSVLHPVKVQTVANEVVDGKVTDVTYDTFFPQSLEESYGVPNTGTSGIEGTYFPYWKQATGLDAPTNGSSSDTNSARQRNIIDNVGSQSLFGGYWLRSCSPTVVRRNWYMSAYGYLANTLNSNTYRELPACVIS